MCYCFRVDNMNLKNKAPAVVFFLLLLLIATLSLLDLREKRKLAAEKFLQEQIAKKEAEEKNYLLGKFDPSIREDFVLIPKAYITDFFSDLKMYLRKETFNAFLKMKAIAFKDGIELKIASATRNFDEQKQMWDDEWSGVKLMHGQNLAKDFPDGFDRFKKKLEYMAVPGTSRHHWGTDMDINGAYPQYFETEKGAKEYAWLVKNAAAFGFCQTYRDRGIDRRTGYNEEKWHWSYLPLSRGFTQEYKRLVTNADVNRFLGDQYVTNQDLINNYVLDINPECI